MTDALAVDLDLRKVFSQFASGVTVVTCTNRDGIPHGATVTAFTAVSMSPPLCQVTLKRESKACALLGGQPFAVNVLAADQTDIAMNFAGRPCTPGPVWRDGPTAPIICGAAATMSCRPWANYDGGDHIIFIGEIIASECTGKPPLLYHSSTFHQLGAPVADMRWYGSLDDPVSGWFAADSDFTPVYLSPSNEGAASR